MMLKIAYVGEPFHGFAHQPGLRTVEGDLLNVLKKIGCTQKIFVASRTDRGVSALSNVIRVDIQNHDICRILTAFLEDIWVYQYSFGNWNPRHCTKHYIYFLPGKFDTHQLEKCCQLFSGIHDFTSFTKAKGNGMKEISVSYEVKKDVILFHFTGKSFLWEMIRRCVTCMNEYLLEKRTESEITTLLQGSTEKISPAPPGNLLLADLVYENSFITDWFAAEKMRKAFQNRFIFHSVKKSIFEECLDTKLK